MTKIILTDWGIANNYGDFIEINRNLLKYPSLVNPIMKHELLHSDKTFSIYDLKHDLFNDGIDNLELIKFMIKHPKTLTQLLPICWTKKKGFVIDINLSLIYLFYFSLVFLAVTVFFLLS